MLMEPIMMQLKELQLLGMAEAMMRLSQQSNSLSWLEAIGTLVSQEILYRQNKRYKRLIQQAKLRYSQASLEAVDYHYTRFLDKERFQRLIDCQWIHHHQNILFIGATGLGKTYLACALGQIACRNAWTVHYIRLSKLLEKLRIASADGSLSRYLLGLAKTAVLIIDDFGIEGLSAQQRHWLLEIIEDRYQLQSTIITTQLPIDVWYEYIGDNTIADALLDRLLNRAIIFNLKGQSMRQQETATIIEETVHE